MQKKIGNLILLFLMLTSPIFADDVSIKVFVDKSIAELEDQIALSIELSGTRESAHIELPELPGFSIINPNSPATSSSVQIINGSMSQKVTYTYYLQPKQAGDFIISSFYIQIKNKKYKTNPINIKIIKSSDGSSSGAKPVFITMTASNLKPYMNEEVTVITKFYIRNGVRLYQNSISFGKQPSYSGVWHEEYEQKGYKQLEPEVIDGVAYNVYEIRKDALFPTLRGKIDLESVEVVVQVVKPRAQSRRRSPLDGFFNDDFFGGQGNVVKKTLSAPSITLNVKSFPTQTETHFKNFSGRLNLSATLDKETVKTNESVKLTVILQGEGNFQTLTAPEFFISPDIDQFEPTVKSDVYKNRHKISGRKVIEYALVPRIEGEQSIGPLLLSYFDTTEKKVKTLKVDLPKLKVLKGKSHTTISDQNYVNAKKNIKQLDQDIRYIRNQSDAFQAKNDFLYLKWYYYAGYLLVLVLFGFFYYVLTQRETISSDSKLRRKKEASSKVHKFLKEASTHQKNGDSSHFFVAVQHAITGYVADKLSLEAAGFTTEILQTHLEKKDIENSLINEAIDILNTCDFYRFANPENPSQEMEKIYQRSSEILNKLTKQL